jgi:hypothetical protein
MTNKIILDKAAAAVKEENERRVSKGMAKMNKWEDQPVFESQPEYNMNNQDLRLEIGGMLIGGIVEQYGQDSIDSPMSDSIDPRPMIDRLIDRFKHQPLQKEPISEPTAPSLDEDGEDLSELKINDLRSRVRAKGEKLDLSDKKEDLIKKLQG